MDTRAMMVFLSVAETLNFSHSATRLHMSVSAVSRTISKLEDELGRQLLERDKRHMQLTRAGRTFRDYAQRAMADFQQMRHRLGGTRELSGEISLYCSVTASFSILAPILEAFRAGYPAVDLMLHTGDQADGIHRVLAGQDDLAISGFPRDYSPRLEFLTLRSTPLRLYVPTLDCAVRDMVLSHEEAAGSYDWSSIPFIVPERGITKELIDNWFLDNGIRPHIYAQVAGHEAIVAMVSLGLGVGIVPELVASAGGTTERVAPMPVSNALPILEIGLCCLGQRLDDPVVRSFWQVAAQARLEMF